MIPDIAELGVPIVTQPGFLVDRGDRFVRELESDERDDLYRFRSLLDAGIKVICSSDAPYGPYDPWLCINTAMVRSSEIGEVISPAEIVSFDTAFSGYLLDDELINTRRVEVGAPANLVALDKNRTVAHVWLYGQLLNLD